MPQCITKPIVLRSKSAVLHGKSVGFATQNSHFRNVKNAVYHFLRELSYKVKAVFRYFFLSEKKKTNSPDNYRLIISWIQKNPHKQRLFVGICMLSETLSTKAELLDDCTITLDVALVQIVEKRTTLTYKTCK